MSILHGFFSYLRRVTNDPKPLPRTRCGSWTGLATS